MGGGGLQGSIDGRPYPFVTYGGGVWLDDDTVLVQLAPTAILATWRPHEDKALPQTLEPPRGANFFCAGGGRWLAQLVDEHTGVYGSLGSLPSAGLLWRGASPDGTLGYIPDYQRGIGLVLVAPDGSRTVVEHVVCSEAQVLGPGVAIWKGGAVGRAPVRPALPNAQNLLLCRVADEDWLVYWAEGVGLVAQMDGAPDGYVLETRPVAFNHDVRAVNDELMVAWSLTQGERPQDLVKLVVDRSQPRVLLAPPFVLPPIGRPILIAPFFRDTNILAYGGDNALARCNASVIVDAHGLPAETDPDGRVPKMIISPECLWEVAKHPEWWPRVVGVYVGNESNDGGMALTRHSETARLLQDRLGLPNWQHVTYTAGHVWPDALRPTDWIGVQVYMSVGQGPTDALHIGRTGLAALRHRWNTAIIGQVYDRANPTYWTEDRIAALLPVYWQLAREFPNVRAILLFSEGRKGGYRDKLKVEKLVAQMTRLAGVVA